MAEPCPVYRPRKPHLSPFYPCVQDHYESLEMLWPERFEKRYGFWRPYLKDVMIRYLACGDFHEGFARIRGEKCGTERILAYSCKRRYLCPSCHQKRAVAFGEWVLTQVLPPVPYRHFVLSIPKILRRSGMNTSTSTMEAFTQCVIAPCEKGMEKAAQAQRMTVMDRDIPLLDP